jgi:hypothetical protein
MEVRLLLRYGVQPIGGYTKRQLDVLPTKREAA